MDACMYVMHIVIIKSWEHGWDVQMHKGLQLSVLCALRSCTVNKHHIVSLL